jgi:uncharacterized protein YyaL (SSP411 family)
MEHESFEDAGTAELMNGNFVNIKIDREERPDLDHIYMDAVQAMTGSGGWPLNVFLTPAGKPFYGGTYFPPQKAFNRPSWKEILLSVAQAFNERRNEIDSQAENLTEHLLLSNAFSFQKEADKSFDASKPDEAFANILRQSDKEWGGFGKAPKFPQTFTIQFLLRYSYLSKNKEAINQARLSLDKMIQGGIYDQVGGGFSRYSTDEEWLAPHFEKMLYDNALLVSVLSDAFQLTGDESYKEVIEETIDFVLRELLDGPGGFYSALDADSEGEEGKFYVWRKKEIEEILGKNAEIFCAYYDISEKGNWHEAVIQGSPHGPSGEGKNILRVKMPLKNFAQIQKIDAEKLRAIIGQGRKKLLEKRNLRVRPLLDDKILLGWNALMNIACSKAFAATGIETYRQAAIINMQFLLDNLCRSGNEFYHTWKEGKAKFPAFLDDYAFMISALIHLQEITADKSWLLRAKDITDFVIDNFSEPETGFFYYTIAGQKDVIIRKKEIYDGAVPSGNSVMAYNLYQLSILLGNKSWKKRSETLVSLLSDLIIKYPTSFGIWACLLQEIITGTNEIAVTGKSISSTLMDLLKRYIPQRVVMASEKDEQLFPLLAGKPITDPPSIWLCRDYSCQQPVQGVDELITLINRPENR